MCFRLFVNATFTSPLPLCIGPVLPFVLDESVADKFLCTLENTDATCMLYHSVWNAHLFYRWVFAQEEGTTIVAFGHSTFFKELQCVGGGVGSQKRLANGEMVKIQIWPKAAWYIFISSYMTARAQACRNLHFEIFMLSAPDQRILLTIFWESRAVWLSSVSVRYHHIPTWILPNGFGTLFQAQTRRFTGIIEFWDPFHLSECLHIHASMILNKRSAQERISVIEFRFLSSRTKPLHLSLKDCHGIYFRDTTRKPCRWKLLRGAWLLHRLAAFGNVIGSATVETGLTMPRWQPEG